jgi:hypothetical protein
MRRNAKEVTRVLRGRVAPRLHIWGTHIWLRPFAKKQATQKLDR